MRFKSRVIILTTAVLNLGLIFSLFRVQASSPRQGSLPAISVSNAANVKQVALMKGHTKPVFSLAFSPDGKTLASASIDTTVGLWDVAAGKQITLLKGHTSQVAAVGFSTDGASLLSAGYDGTNRLWDVKAGKQTGMQGADPQGGSLPTGVGNLVVTFSPDSSKLAYGQDTGGLYIWDLATQQKITLDASPASYGGVSFNADGTILAGSVDPAGAGDQSKLIKVWDVKAGKATTTLTGPDGSMYGPLALSPDGTLAVIDTDLDGNNKVQFWDVKASKPGLRLDAGSGYISGLTFSPDGSLLAVASQDKTLVLWDVKAGKSLIMLASSDTQGGFGAVKFSADGAVLASGNIDGTIQLWTVTDRQRCLQMLLTNLDSPPTRR